MKISCGTCRNIKMPERRSLMKYTKEDILRIADEENVSFIRLQFTDILGSLKNVAITRSQLEKALNNKCMFDGSSIEGFVRIEESDMYLHPDLDTFVIFPWRTSEDHKVARLICDVYCSDGTPFEGDPRYVLRRAIKKAADMGYSCNVGPECEFFLFHIDENGKPTRWKIENSWGDKNGAKGYYVCSDSWFDQYVFQAAVEEEFLGGMQSLLAQEPIELAPWDPMGTLAD